MTQSLSAVRISTGTYVLIGLGLIAATALTLFLMGQVPICKCGYIKLWHSEPLSAENSQHISDWYSLSHAIHGFAFYAALAWLAKSQPVGLRLTIAIVIEAAWEIFENTDFVINRYREVTISLDYFGDSVLNSVSDIGFMVLGFYLAGRLPVWVSIGAVVALELIALVAIRDNLTLNIIMLLYPLDAIKTWQAG